MNCKFHVFESEPVPGMGGDDCFQEHHYCERKRWGDSERLNVYLSLQAKGLEVSMITDECPLALTGNWKACPFYEA